MVEPQKTELIGKPMRTRKEITYILCMEKIRKLGEVEKAVCQILDKNAEMSNAWNDPAIGQSSECRSHRAALL